MAISKERLEELLSLLSSTKNFEQKGMMFADFIGRENAESLRRRYYNMKDRCYNSKSVAYKNYGERNITICKEWLEDKYNFYIWALRNGFDISLTLDRIDNNCGYYPKNCRWVDRKMQNNNKRNIKRHKVNGEFLTITEASKKFGISFKKLESRMRLNNLSLEDAVNLGLIDKLGNIDTALIEAKKMAGISTTQKFNIKIYPKPKTFTEKLNLFLRQTPQISINQLANKIGLDINDISVLQHLQYDCIITPFVIYK